MAEHILITPTWGFVLQGVANGVFPASELRIPVMYADAISKAKENGLPSITFTFTEDGVSFDDGEPDAN